MSTNTPEGFEARTHISNEATAGISFANVLLGVGLALVGLLVTNPPAADILTPAVFASCIAFSSFFATLFYANVHGALRLYSEEQYKRAMIYGNAATEYLGVFLLLATFPQVVFAYTGNVMLTWSCAVIVGVGFWLYSFSGFDLLSRWLTVPLFHGLMVLLVMAATTGVTYLNLYGPALFQAPAAFGLLGFLFFLTILDVTVTLDRMSAERRRNKEK